MRFFVWNGADLESCIIKMLFLALDAQQQVDVVVVILNDWRDFEEEEEVSQLLLNHLMMSLSSVEVRYLACH